jgi:Flp pilus assembly protein TadB
MVNRSVSLMRNNVFLFALGALIILLSLSLLSSLRNELPGQWTIFNDPFSLALSAASVLAGGWLLLRYRRGGGRRHHAGSATAQTIGSASAELSVNSNGLSAETDDESAAFPWLSRLFCAILAVVLIALVTGDPVMVVHVLALGMVVIGFVLIIFLVPRGL